jgi:hypothetical protein
MTTPLELIMYSKYSESTIADALGAADYSYFFVLQRFHKLLVNDFAITRLHALDALEGVINSSRAAGNHPLLLCFTPPHDLPLDASCPVIPVFAWEFDTLPDVSWNGDTRTNWAEMLRRCPAAITHSEHTVRVSRYSLGDDYNIVSAPASVWDSYNTIQDRQWTGHARQIVVEAAYLDTHAPSWREPGEVQAGTQHLTLSGCVFTSVLNPHDGRKNLTDMISAFADAFRYQSDACLLLKFTNSSSAHYIESARQLLCRLAPFHCRVLIISGYLPAESFHDLVRATTFCVNASTGEGQCLPLMEFMSAGKPAISPDHTAMAEYVDDTNAFIVRSSPEPASWPQDSRQMLTCRKMRISWQSLLDAYRAAYATATTDADRYTRMSQAAEARLHAHNAAAVLRPRLGDFLRTVAGSCSSVPGRMAPEDGAP